LHSSKCHQETAETAETAEVVMAKVVVARVEAVEPAAGAMAKVEVASKGETEETRAMETEAEARLVLVAKAEVGAARD